MSDTMSERLADRLLDRLSELVCEFGDLPDTLGSWGPTIRLWTVVCLLLQANLQSCVNCKFLVNLSETVGGRALFAYHSRQSNGSVSISNSWLICLRLWVGIPFQKLTHKYLSNDYSRPYSRHLQVPFNQTLGKL